MNNDPIQQMTNQLNEAANRLASMMKVGLIGMVGLLVLIVALRFWFQQRQARKNEQQLDDMKKIMHAIHVAQVQQQAATIWYEEPEASPFDHAVSIAINNAFDEDTTVLADDDLVAGEEARMHVLNVEEYHFCEHCMEDTGVAVTMVMEKLDGTPASIITSVACSTCHQVLAS